MMSYCNSTTNHMYPNKNVCLFERDAYGDPLYCPSSEHFKHCEHHECPGMFKCDRDYCIPSYMVCDGIVDCLHKQDEQQCSDVKCERGLLCRSSETNKTKRCVHPHHICDGIIHCPDYQDDEKNCFPEDCSEQCDCNVHIMKCSSHDLYITIPSNIKMLYLFRTALRIMPNDTRDFHVLIVKLSAIDSAGIVPFLRGMFLMRELNFINTSIDVLYKEIFKDCWALQSLIFIDNHVFYVEILAFSMIRHFRVLLLKFLRIHEISNDAFMGSSNIQILDLSHNNIHYLHRKVFNGLLDIILINLTFNDITKTDIGTGSFINNGAIVLIDHNEQCCHLDTYHCLYIANNTVSRSDRKGCDIPIKSTLLRVDSGCTGLLMLCIYVASIINYKKYFGKCLSRNITLAVLLTVDALNVVYPLTIAFGITYYKSSDVSIKSKWISSIQCIIASSVTLVCMLMSSLCWLAISTLSVWVTKFALVKRQISARTVICFFITSFIIVLSGVITVKYAVLGNSNICLMFRGTNDNDWKIYVVFAVLAIYFLSLHGLTTVLYCIIIHHTAKSSKQANLDKKRTQVVRRRASILCSGKFFLWVLCFTFMFLPVFLPNFDTYLYSCIYLISLIINQVIDVYLVILF